MRYKSIEHLSHNENGCEQITIEYKKTLWQWLLCRPHTVEVFVYKGGDWVNRETNKRATQQQWFRLESIETAMRYDEEPSGAMKRGRSTRRYSRSKSKEIE